MNNAQLDMLGMFCILYIYCNDNIYVYVTVYVYIYTYSVKDTEHINNL